MRCSDLVLWNYAMRLVRMHSKTHQCGKWVIGCCWLTCLTGLSSGKNMGLEEESSTDALATSWKIRNWSCEEEKAKTRFWQTSPRSPQKVKRRLAGGFVLTACKLSIRITPLILTAMSLREATLTWHWKGRFSVSTWFCEKEADISHGKRTRPKGTLTWFALYRDAWQLIGGQPARGHVLRW